MASAEAAQRVLKALCKELFKTELEIELVIVAPEPGSLRQILKVTISVAKNTGLVAGGAWAIFFTAIQALETDFGKAVIEGLTGKLPAEIAKEYSQSAAERVAQSKNESERERREKEAEKEICLELENILTNLTSESLAAPRSRLEKANINPTLKYELTDAQAEVFEACLSDGLVKSIEFEKSNIPPIPRNEFAMRAIRPSRPEKEIDKINRWVVGLETVVVTSPNFEEEDQEARKWKGRNREGKVILFTVEDKEFWAKFHRKLFRFTESTCLTVQLATRFENDRPKESKVIRVIKIDDQELGESLDENALLAILGELAEKKNQSRQSSLFD